jgi:hypothetical protein
MTFQNSPLLDENVAVLLMNGAASVALLHVLVVKILELKFHRDKELPELEKPPDILEESTNI